VGTTQQRDMQKALAVLQEAYGNLVERLSEAVLNDEDAIKDASFSYAYQEVEDRYGPRIIHLSHLINALQSATQRPASEEIRVETVIADAETLSDEINRRLRALRGTVMKDLNLQKLDDGRFLVLLTLARPVFVRAGPSAR